MSLELHFNNQQFNVEKGSSLFEYAESFGIRVPTSCEKQGKCKECLVEVIEGMEFLSKPVQKEAHLQGNFRLSCRTKIIADSGIIRCNTMRRGRMKIENKAMHLSGSTRKVKIDPKMHCFIFNFHSASAHCVASYNS